MKPGCYHFNQISKTSFMRDCPSTRRIFFSTSESDSALVPSASGSPWPAPSLRMALVGVVKLGCRGAASSSSSDRQDICNRLWKEISTRIKELQQCVFQSSEQVRSWLGPVKDAGRPGAWDWKERCSSEHMRRDVLASVTPQSRQHCRPL